MYIIIIIMAGYKCGYSCPSFATPLFSSLLSADRQVYISYRHRAAVCRFELDVLPLHIHVKGFHRSISLITSSLFVLRVSCLSNFDSFCDGLLVAD